jgi:hypothetical protein
MLRLDSESSNCRAIAGDLAGLMVQTIISKQQHFQVFLPGRGRVRANASGSTGSAKDG